MAESVDLVVTMSSGHREAVARLAPSTADRTFTLKELVHLLDRLDQAPSHGGPGERMAVAVSAAGKLRGSGAADDLTDEDIPDPLGLGPDAFRAVAWQIEALTGRLVDGLFGPAVDDVTAPDPSRIARAD
jgi:protein-tyrosine-phosphatase